MTNRYYTFIVLLVFSGLYALRSEVENYVSKMWVGDFIEYVYKACACNALFNILLTLALMVSSFVVGKRTFYGKGNILRCVGYGFAIAYLFNTSHWIYAKTFLFGASYDTLLIVSLLTLLIIDLTSVAREFFPKDDANQVSCVNDDKKGYCMDEAYMEHRETGWGNYIGDLLSLMPKERLKQESLAIGITGSWGSGKTSFLNNMKKCMEADYRVVSFNPWTCTNKEQIISRFFAQMSEEIVGEDDSLQNTIYRYRDLVLDADIHPSITFLAKILPAYKKDDNVEALRFKIEEAISAEGTKSLAVFIDDLDRLEGDELFEVLRLIRITANFRNVVFIVAYDHDYVCNVLDESKNIKRADEYLHKIFHLEVSLPKFENETLLDIFVEEVSRILLSDEKGMARLARAVAQLKRTVSQLFGSKEVLFVDFVPNFRQVRRFANIFALNLKSALTHTNDIVLTDFLGIELIHFACPDTYQTLMKKPMTLLKDNSSKLSKMSLLIYEGNEDTPCARMLKKLFSNASVTSSTSYEIRSQVSYVNYFSFRLPNNAIGATEFEMTMIADSLDDVRVHVKEWMLKKNSFSYIFRHFKGYYMHGYKEVKVIRNYMCALLEYLPNLTESGIRSIAADRYWIRSGMDCAELERQIIPLFEYAIEKGQHLEKVNELLLSLYNTYPEDYAPDDIPADLLGYNQIKSLVEKSLAQYIKQNGKPLPHEVSDKKSKFNRFLMSASYCSNYYLVNNEYVGVDSNMMVDELIRQYQGSKYDLAEFRKFIDSYMIKTDDPAEEEFEATSILKSINTIFGSFNNMEKFVRNTFFINDDVEKMLNKVREL